MKSQKKQSIRNRLRKILSFTIVCVLMLSLRLSALAASTYKHNEMIIVSGQPDFDSQYTWSAPYSAVDGQVTYECFTIIADDGTKWYAALNPRQTQYYKGAFHDKTLVLKGEYKGVADDGTPAFAPRYFLEGENEQEIKSYLWNHNVWLNDETPNLQAFYDMYRETIQGKNKITVFSISDDGSYLSIDTNPLNADNTSIFASVNDVDYLSYAKELSDPLAIITYQPYANECIQALNNALGLPSWLYGEMCETRAGDGRQKEVFDKVTVSWTYHPKQGLEVMYRKNK